MIVVIMIMMVTQISRRRPEVHGAACNNDVRILEQLAQEPPLPVGVVYRYLQPIFWIPLFGSPFGGQ